MILLDALHNSYFWYIYIQKSENNNFCFLQLGSESMASDKKYENFIENFGKLYLRFG